jgi:putative mRNA 3-end processing factor
VRCDTFVTESTFGLPIYRWPEPGFVFDEINAWWKANGDAGRTSVLFGYSLGKAQRLLSGVDATIGPILVQDAVREFLPAYVAAGVQLPPVEPATAERITAARGRALVIAPPGLDETLWELGRGDVTAGFASGWMLVRAARRQRGTGRGFVLSDHADWPDLISTIRETQAPRILVTHGVAAPLVRWLNENGWQAEALPVRNGQIEAAPAQN